jgi:hypothetical protein
MSDLKDIWQNADTVTEEGNPFYYLSVEGSHSWGSPNTLRLADNFNGSTSGRVYLIVKSEYECVFKIRSYEWGAFQQASFDKSMTDAFNFSFDSPMAAVRGTGFISQMTFTARGGSMVAIAADGDAGKWSKSGDVFHLETVNRGITQPDENWGTGNPDGILLSLTAPHGDWTDKQTTSFRWPDGDAQMELTLMSFKKKTTINADGEEEAVYIVPSVGDVVDNSDSNYGENIVLDEEKWYLEHREIVTDKSEKSHTVSVWKETDTSTTTYGDGRGATQDIVMTYWVFVDGTQESFYATLNEAKTASQLRVQQIKELGEQGGGNDGDIIPPVSDILPPVSDIIPLAALLGGGVFLIVLIVVFVAMYAKGKGGA